MGKQIVPFKFHPRVFNSLGADLVTDDIVSIIELVKNAYDAGANEVKISFNKILQKEENNKTGKNKSQNVKETEVLEIIDNGQGMTEEIIKNVWFTVATPYKEQNKIVKIDKDTERTVSGEKGLGRLSTARLGSSLEVYTKSKKGCWLVSMDWDKVTKADDISNTGGTIEAAEFPYSEYKSGTVLRITNLHDVWFLKDEKEDEDEKEEDEQKHKEEKLEMLENNLSRFISPFSDLEKTGRLQIILKNPLSESEIKIKSPTFLKYPIYSIKGEIMQDGHISYLYNYDDGDRKNRKKSMIKVDEISKLKLDKNGIPEFFCGPFRFEIRVWDVDSDSTELFTKRFNIKKTKLREQISFHKGISVYRDGVLVLPKTTAARDWLGLDLRRISRVGKRISNRQIIGYVSISGEKNEKIEDASNREGFKDTKEVRIFKKYLTKIVETLEQLRENDKLEAGHKEPPFSDVLAGIIPSELLDRVENIVNTHGTYEDILQAVREYESKANNAHEEISKRAYYYSRLASIGTLAAFLIHEIRNRTGSISDLHTKLREPEIHDKIKNLVEKYLFDAEDAVNALEILSDTFSPLAMKNVNSKKMICDPVGQLKACISSFKSDIEKKGITIDHNQVSVNLNVFPGELSTIYNNLLLNSIYWLTKNKNDYKNIKIQFNINRSKNRLTIRFSDSGPGVDEGMEDKIFWPGWTKRSDGFGMGLTVASELVSQYGGKMSLIKPGELGGLTLKFDLPIYNNRSDK